MLLGAGEIGLSQFNSKTESGRLAEAVSHPAFTEVPNLLFNDFLTYI